MDSSGKARADHYASVYKATTVPLKANRRKEGSAKAKKPQRRDKSDLGENFIAPDGGWAWLVCVAAGLSNFSIYPCVQQFGFIFRDRLLDLGFTSSEITTIINTNPAVSACTGLLNGPMFRRFTFRQVAMTGSLLMFLGIMMTAFCETFVGYMVAYALFFGFGMGISVSASSLAINTYFKNKRRKAAGFSWTITGAGPIVFPHLVTFLLSIYGVQGTVFIFAAISLHSFMCALIYQPVLYHTRGAGDENTAEPLSIIGEQSQHLCKYCEMQMKKEKGIFSSQYLYQDDDEDQPGFEIIEPGTPMLSRANDGWYGSRLSLASNKPRLRTISSSKDVENAVRFNRMISEEEELKLKSVLKPNNFKKERDNAIVKGNLSNKYGGGPLKCTCAEDRALLELHRIEAFDDVVKSTKNKERRRSSDSELSVEKITFLQKVVAFFDLDLLRDYTFVNLVVGLTFINFGELNFSILTPFILKDFGFETSQITFSISVLAGMDIVTRFLMPFLTEKISWDNRVFFLIGVVGISLGRTVVACTRSFTVVLITFAIIGIFKGVRTIFWPLIIPSCVPLKRLPAASGLQLLISGLFTLAAGPFVGLVRDRYNYAIALHCLNIMTFVSAISWTVEALVRRYLQKPSTLNCD